MSPAQLLAHFDRLSEAPDAVPRLRRFILDLVVRGKLTEQNPNDDSAEELLRRIHTVREAKTGLRRSASANRPIRDEEIPFAAPPGMVFGRLADLANIEKGSTAIQKAKPGPYPLVTLAEQRASSADYQFDVAAAIVPLVSSTGHGHASLKRLHYQEGKFALGNILCAVVPIAPDLVSARFIYEYLWAYRESVLIEKMSGTANVSLTIDKIGDAPIPIVPPRSQARLHDLMVLCDRLEAAQAERETRRDRLVAASLNLMNELTAADDAQPFRDHTRVHLRDLPRFTTRPEHFRQLRQTILGLAAIGRLVPQDPADEPASELLARIGRQRTSLLEQGLPNENEARNQLRKQRNQTLPAKLPPLPRGWQWATLMQCCALVVDCHNKTAPYAKTGVVLLRTTNVRDGTLNLNQPKFVDEETYARWSARCQPEPGDLLITREAPMGEVCIIPPGMRVCLGQRMMLIRLVPHTILSRFMLYSLRDPCLMSRVQDKPVGATVQHLRVGGVETLLVPLPPLPEQHRIVAKLDELMALCDRLEAQLTTAHTESRRLLDAVLHQALTPTTEERGPRILAG